MQYFSDFKARSYAQAREALKNNDKITDQNFAEAILTLTAIGSLSPAVDPSTISPEIKERCQSLNRYLILGNDNLKVQFLSSPVVQGGFFIGDTKMQLLRFYLQNEQNHQKNSKENLVESMLKQIESSGGTLKQKGTPITDKEEQKKVLGELVEGFLNTDLKALQRLYII